MASRRLPAVRTSSIGVWALVLTPAVAILICGILILVYQQSVFDVTIGLLLVLFCATLGAGATITLMGIRADRKLAALQVDFVSKVSHELKTPLTSIKMFVETLMMRRVTEPARVEHCLDVINKETDRLSLLIGRLLSWGAMEAGAFRLDPQPIEVKELVNAAVTAFQPQLMLGKIRLNVTIDDDLPIIRADRAALVDALVNLLNNAMKYGADADVIDLTARSPDGNKVEIAVKDRGIGISRREQPRIFERFYRAEQTVEDIAGTGLGLSIARYVVIAHGGNIDVESVVGNGSTFTVVLPAGEKSK